MRNSRADASTLRPPATRIEPLTENLHGIEIQDPYRWLEDGESAEVRRWVEEQNRYCASVLGSIPGREQIQTRLAQLLSIDTVAAPGLRGPYSFFMRRSEGQNQAVLYVREGFEGQARPLVDPNPLSADGTVTIDWWYPSQDGRLLAYGISSAGDERSTLYVIDVAGGKRLADTIPHTHYASLAWLPDGSGFYYTRLPAPGTVPPGEEHYNQRVFFHRLGDDPAADCEVFGAGRAPQDTYGVSLSPDGRYLLVSAAQGWARSELFLRDLWADGEFVPVAVGSDALFVGRIDGERLYILTNEGAPNYRLYVTDVNAPGREHWRELIAESETVLEDFRLAGGRLVVLGLRNAASRLLVYSADGSLEDEIRLPALGTVRHVSGCSDQDDLLFLFTSFFVPPTIYRYSLRDKALSVYERTEAGIDADGFEVSQVWYRSKDGTRVPMFVAHRRGLELNGDTPTLLTGYGGFNVAKTPEFAAPVYYWLERGGVFALPNLRGGSEFGEGWHQAGMLERKQNVFDDFIAAAEWLIASGYTRPERLGISGRSNGGLLVGAALTQRPDLFKAVVCTVPLLDMLRYHHFLIARLWIPEYGCADDPQQAAYLRAYSPYHNVRPGMRYPAVLFTTAESDSRVDPLHARKMAALLQQVTGGDSLVLLQVETRAGHGVGKPLTKIIDEQVAIWGFITWQLGLQG